MASICAWENSARRVCAARARRASARASRDRSEVFVGVRRRLRWPYDRRYPFGQDPFDFGVRPGDDVHGDEFAHAPRGRGTGVGGGLHRADIAAHQDGDVAGADVLGADQAARLRP